MPGIDIETSASQPASMSVDGRSATQHKLTDLIEAEKHVARKAAARNPINFLTRMQIVSPGSF